MEIGREHSAKWGLTRRYELSLSYKYFHASRSLLCPVRLDRLLASVTDLRQLRSMFVSVGGTAAVMSDLLFQCLRKLGRVELMISQHHREIRKVRF
jgi:hypothetical protein